MTIGMLLRVKNSCMLDCIKSCNALHARAGRLTVRSVGGHGHLRVAL